MKSLHGIAALVALAMCTFWSTSVRASDPDPWFGRDKALHFGVSAAIAATGYTVSAAAFNARAPALFVGGGVALAAGAGKELFDMTGTGDPSWRDFTWDVLGTLAGLAVAWSVDLLVRGTGDAHPPFGAPRSSISVKPAGVVIVF